jgi:MSHA pilin protein MshD
MKRRQQGMTLVELVIAIVVVSIAVTSVMGAMATIGGRSADPIVLMQAQAIAESYMDEITAKAYTLPDANPTCIKPITAQAIAESYMDEITAKAYTLPDANPTCTGPFPTTKTRATFTLVCDYQGLNDAPPQDSTGADITGLAAYSVAVAITKVPNLVEMGPATSPALDAVKIAVTVTSPKGPYTLVGYRTRY